MVGLTNELERKKWLKATLKSIPAGLRILDAGAGELANKKYCSHLEYVSQDFCEYKGVGDSLGLQTGTWDNHNIDIVSDISRIPEEDETFDVILCSEVLEHVPNPVMALSEFNRLLKKGGLLIVTAPFCSLTHFSPYHYSTGFNCYFYELHLDQLGFEGIEISHNGNYFEYIGQEVRRVASVADRYTPLRIRWVEKLAVKVLLRALNRFSKKDRGSEELLCYGYHVMAKKR